MTSGDLISGDTCDPRMHIVYPYHLDAEEQALIYMEVRTGNHVTFAAFQDAGMDVSLQNNR
jgi:hypothetical protein